MTVYIDDVNLQFRNMTMCHMMADTPEELHAMAAKIGLKRSWAQSKGSMLHYDVCLSMKRKAIMFGAKEITSKQIVKMFLKKAQIERVEKYTI